MQLRIISNKELDREPSLAELRLSFLWLMKKILLFPGAFNPPHNGHVLAIEVALKRMSFDEIWIMPSGKRNDKTISVTYEERRDLGNLFVEYLQTKITIPVKLMTNELDDRKQRPTEEILAEVKSQPEIQFSQLIGLDGYLKVGKKIPNEKFVVIQRPGYALSSDFAQNDNVVILDGAVSDISSTSVRILIQKHDLKYKELVPEKIATYINEHEIYL
jgi:nicotinate-nucleotide adenylyltransferase